MANISGYTGIFKQPIQIVSTYGPSVYCVSDSNKQEALFIILTPEAYLDVYNLAKNVDIQNVKLFIPALDVMFISDLFNLFMALRNVKPNIKWIFPSVPTIDTSVEFTSGQEISATYTHPVDSSIGITYVKDTYEKTRDFYDIVVMDGTNTIYLAQYMNEDKAFALYNDASLTQIHIPFSSTLYGGLSYTELISLHPEYKQKIYINSFLTVAEYDYCKSKSGYQMGRMVYYDII